jgi:hypothetical protein
MQQRSGSRSCAKSTVAPEGTRTHKKGSGTILDSLDPLFVWRSPSPLLSSLSRRRTCPAEICFQPFRLSKPSGQNYSRLTLANLRGSLITFCSAALATKSESWSSAVTIDIHLLDPDVDRSMAEYEECRLEWTWILIGTSGGWGRDSESFQAS